MSEWGGVCAKCGHPSSYHGVGFCMVDAGGANKRQCDCSGYSSPRCECGWTGVGNHYHDKRMGRAETVATDSGAKPDDPSVHIGAGYLPDQEVET